MWAQPAPKPWEIPSDSEHATGQLGSSNQVDDADEANETQPLVAKKKSDTSRSCCNLGLYDFMDELREHFGCRLLVLLFAIQHVLKGFVMTFVGQSAPYLYKSFHVPAPQVQIYGSAAMSPWALKPIIGLVSDVFPIFGYNKAPYMIVVSVGGLAAFLYVGVGSSVTVVMLVLSLWAIQLQISTCDLLSEAKYAEKIQLAPAHGPAMLSFVWFGMTVGSFAAVAIAGPVLEKFGANFVFTAAAVPAVLVLLPIVFGFLEENRMSDDEVAQARQRLTEQKEATVLCILMFLGTMTITIVNMLVRNPYVVTMVAVSTGVVMLISFSLVLSPVIARFNAFTLIQTSLGVSLSGATFYFYTDGPEEYPEGPHFSKDFYNSVIPSVGAVCSLIGIFMYQRYMSTWKYRSMLVVTNLVLSAFALLDIIMFTRQNKKLGIPDHYFVLGLSVVESIVGNWQWMPQVVILAALCPKGMEATMYALLAGCHNLGGSIASNAGAALLHYLGCQPRAAPNESAQFEKLWIAAIVAVILPCVSTITLYRLVPDVQQNEGILSPSDDPTSGSLWRRWCRIHAND